MCWSADTAPDTGNGVHHRRDCPGCVLEGAGSENCAVTVLSLEQGVFQVMEEGTVYYNDDI